MSTKIGIIGGSGLSKAEFFKNPTEVTLSTSWGEPSSALFEGTINGIPVVVLSRHGREHTIPPSQVNYRANVQALKDAGCTRILATTAVGSLRAEIGRGDLVILDQFIDFTKQRKMTYFERFAPGEIKHAPMADPFDAAMRAILIETAAGLGLVHHTSGTVVTIEGPRFSTRAESRMFRILGADVVNMSIATEAVLAGELEIPYAAVAMSTDYDSWNEDAEPVSWEEILRVFAQNTDNVLSLLTHSIAAMAALDA